MSVDGVSGSGASGAVSGAGTYSQGSTAKSSSSSNSVFGNNIALGGNSYHQSCGQNLDISSNWPFRKNPS